MSCDRQMRSQVTGGVFAVVPARTGFPAVRESEVPPRQAAEVVLVGVLNFFRFKADGSGEPFALRECRRVACEDESEDNPELGVGL